MISNAFQHFQRFTMLLYNYFQHFRTRSWTALIWVTSGGVVMTKSPVAKSSNVYSTAKKFNRPRSKQNSNFSIIAPCQFHGCYLHTVQISIQRCLALTWERPIWNQNKTTRAAEERELKTSTAQLDNSNALSPNKLELHDHSSSILFYNQSSQRVNFSAYLPTLSKGSFIHNSP